ncbi:VOC family protein [Parvularcula maris]|uniref:VOC family protein n=1 Tax=Parvularcula maris TaxID=2965077 RepID=A0A9X2RKJ9_9PROT|nr:VOC family protein [Parvularcula maris]MCQ8185868.1 VOC family protein [Parvularcula maris]
MTLRSVPSAAKADDILAVHFDVPDLETARCFLTDFGLTEVVSNSQVLGMAGSHGGPVIYRADKGDTARFRGFSFAVSREGLEALAEIDGRTVEDSDAGPSVCLTDPDGWSVTAVAPSNEPPSKEPGYLRNEHGREGRPGGRLVLPPGSSSVRRLGHVVLKVGSYRESLAWYQDRFGVLVSDEALGMDDKTVVGAFLRCDRGKATTDHHTLFIMEGGEPAFEHAAFEVEGIDDLMRGHAHLEREGYKHDWGVGRHVVGAHMFDYWRDPFGFILEHWTDGDRIDATDQKQQHTLMSLLDTQWGPVHPLLRGARS